MAELRLGDRIEFLHAADEGHAVVIGRDLGPGQTFSHRRGVAVKGQVESRRLELGRHWATVRLDDPDARLHHHWTTNPVAR